MPDWAKRLDEVHDWPYTGRYPEMANMFGWPTTAAMITGLNEVFALVRARLRTA